MHTKTLLFLLPVLSIVLGLSFTSANNGIYGRWKLVRDKSTDLVTWRYRQLELEISNSQGAVTILQEWSRRKKVALIDSMTVEPGKDATYSIRQTRTWPANWYMGVLSKPGSKRKTNGNWQEEQRALQVETEEIVQTSQGEAVVKTVREYRVQSNGDTLVVNEKRSTRPTPIVLVFEKLPVE